MFEDFDKHNKIPESSCPSDLTMLTMFPFRERRDHQYLTEVDQAVRPRASHGRVHLEFSTGFGHASQLRESSIWTSSPHNRLGKHTAEAIKVTIPTTALCGPSNCCSSLCSHKSINYRKLS